MKKNNLFALRNYLLFFLWVMLMKMGINELLWVLSSVFFLVRSHFLIHDVVKVEIDPPDFQIVFVLNKFYC